MTRRAGREREMAFSTSALRLAPAALLAAMFVGRSHPSTHFLCNGFLATNPPPGDGNVNPTTTACSISAYRSNFNTLDEGEGNDKIQPLQRRRVALNNIFRSTISIVTMTAPTTPSTSSITRSSHSSSSSSSSSSTTALALDMDAFESNILSKDTTNDLSPKLNDDEALCKYGAPGKAMGEACSRANMQRKLPGNVDASGKVDRGDYLKCRYEYPIIGGEYVKTRVCKPSGEEW